MTPSQTPLVLQFSLDNPGLASLVAPHFTPNNAPPQFVGMYEQLITLVQQQIHLKDLNLVFMLLSKVSSLYFSVKCPVSGMDINP